MNKLEWIYGRHAVRAALAAGRVRRLFVRSGVELSPDDVERAASYQRTEWRARDFSARFGEDAVHQGVAAQCAPLPLYGLPFLQSLASVDKRLLLVALEGINDPHNLGACARVAAGAGAQALIISSKASAALTPAVAKVASGAMETLPLVSLANLAQSLQLLRDQGLQLIATSERAEASVWAADFSGPTVLLIGNEGRGLSAAVRKLAHREVAIPLSAGVNSLNASTALAVCLFEARRQRTLGARASRPPCKK